MFALYGRPGLFWSSVPRRTRFYDMLIIIHALAEPYAHVTDSFLNRAYLPSHWTCVGSCPLRISQSPAKDCAQDRH